MKTKLVCFDLDDTLIRGCHSVMLPCILNGKAKEHALIQQKEESGELDYISADILRAELFKGLNEKEIQNHFLEIAKPLENIAKTVTLLHQRDIKCIVITVGPLQVAEAVASIYNFDGCYGSDYEVIDGIFTGRIVDYIKAENKVSCLHDFCERNQIKPSECIAIGDGATDIPIFDICAHSIALNALNNVKEKAQYAVDTDDLLDLLPIIDEVRK